MVVTERYIEVGRQVIYDGTVYIFLMLYAKIGVYFPALR